MSNENFRRDLNNVFDDLSGSPSSALRDRVRSSVDAAPEARGPYWIAGVAAAVIAVLIVGVLFVANPFRQPTSSVGTLHSPTPSPSAAPSSVPTPSASPSGQPLVCANTSLITASQGAPPPLDYVSALRTGTHGTYDRLTIEFTNGVPTPIDVNVQDGTAFTLSPSGMRVSLKGQNGILIVMHGTDLHTSYSGSIDIVTGYSGLAEVRRVEDYEGVVQLGLGVIGPACYRTFFLANPNRIVIDVPTS